MVENQQNEMMTPVLFWNDIKVDTKDFLKRNLKRYIPYLGISFLFFLFAVLCLLPIYYFPNRLDVYLISFLFCSIFAIFLVAPSLFAFIDVIVIDSMSEVNEVPIPSKKDLFENYFRAIYAWILKILGRNTRIFGIIFKSILTFIIIFFIVVLPAHFVKISAEPQYFSLFTELKQTINVYNWKAFINILFEIKSLYRVELLIINLLGVLGLAFHTLYGFYFVIFRTTSFSIRYSLKESKQIFKYSVSENKWSFAAFFIHSFKYFIIIYAVLLGIFGYLFTLLVESYFIVFLLSFIFSTLALFITYPYFLKQMIDIDLSFADIFLEGTLKFLVLKVINNSSKTDQAIVEEKNRLETLLKIIKQDRKATYKKLKENKKHPVDPKVQGEEAKIQDEALEKYFKSLEDAIEEIEDD